MASTSSGLIPATQFPVLKGQVPRLRSISHTGTLGTGKKRASPTEITLVESTTKAIPTIGPTKTSALSAFGVVDEQQSRNQKYQEIQDLPDIDALEKHIIKTYNDEGAVLMGRYTKKLMGFLSDKAERTQFRKNIQNKLAELHVIVDYTNTEKLNKIAKKYKMCAPRGETYVSERLLRSINILINPQKDILPDKKNPNWVAPTQPPFQYKFLRPRMRERIMGALLACCNIRKVCSTNAGQTSWRPTRGAIATWANRQPRQKV